VPVPKKKVNWWKRYFRKVTETLWVGDNHSYRSIILRLKLAERENDASKCEL
jgi:hypothetical protein